MDAEYEALVAACAEPIFTYSESDALADGLYVDATEKYPAECWLAGMRFRTVFTTGVWETCVVPSVEAELAGQSLTGRLAAFLAEFVEQARGNESSRDFSYPLEVIAESGTLTRVVIRAHLGVWDGEYDKPYVLFMFEHED